MTRIKQYDKVMDKNDYSKRGTLLGWNEYGDPVISWDSDLKRSIHPDKNSLIHLGKQRPTVVCLCGSTRFKDQFVKSNLEETLKGNIVLSIGCDMKTDDEIFGNLSPEEFQLTKIRLDELHFRKIDMSDEILVLNVGGYIGESTTNEIQYAKEKNKKVRYLEWEE